MTDIDSTKLPIRFSIQSRSFVSRLFVTLVCVFASDMAFSATGLDFPSNGDAPSDAFVAFQWLNPQNSGLPMWGPGNKGVTYIWKYRPRQQNGYYATMWYSRADGHFIGGTPFYDAYYGGHPYPYPPRGGNSNPNHVWELAGMQDGRDTLGTGGSDDDTTSKNLVTDVWYTQALRITYNGDGTKTARFYIDLPSTKGSDYIEYQSTADYGNTAPRSPAITFGDSPWYADFQHERMSGVIRHIKIIAKSLSEADVLAEADSEALVTADGQANVWYMNINPTPDDISDKSGAGHNPTWASSTRPGLAVFADPAPKVFLSLQAVADVNGNNNTDIGVLLRESGTDRNQFFVMDGGSGRNITNNSYGSEQPRRYAAVPDATGDLIPEFAVFLQGSRVAQVKDVVNDTQLGNPMFKAIYDPVALLAVGDTGGGVGPDLAAVGRNASTGKVQAQIKDAFSGTLVRNTTFGNAFVPFDAVVVNNVGDSAAMEIAVLGIDAGGAVQAHVKDAMSGKQISKFNFDQNFTPLSFAAVPDPGGKLTFLAVLGRNSSGVIQAEVRRANNGAEVSKIKFSKTYDPQAFISFADSNGSGSGEISVVGVNLGGAVRAETREIGDGTLLIRFYFSTSYPLVDAIAVNGVAGTGQNEIAVLGQNASGEFRLQIKDLRTGVAVNTIPLP